MPARMLFSMARVFVRVSGNRIPRSRHDAHTSLGEVVKLAVGGVPMMGLAPDLTSPGLKTVSTNIIIAFIGPWGSSIRHWALLRFKMVHGKRGLLSKHSLIPSQLQSNTYRLICIYIHVANTITDTHTQIYIYIVILYIYIVILYIL